MSNPTVPPTATAARIAVSATFLLHALVLGSWLPRIPALKDRLEIGNDDIGLALGVMAIGLLVGTRLVGRAERVGRTAKGMRITLIGQAVALLGPAFAPNLWWLLAAVFVLGAFGGALDVLMNVHAVHVERMYRRPIMSGFHGLWSTGSMLAGAGAAIAARVELDVRVHFTLAAAVCVLLGPLLLRRLLAPDVESAVADRDRSAEDIVGEAAVASPPRPMVGKIVVVFLALMGFGAFMSEGTIADWSAVFLHDERGASQGFAALGFTVFSGAMAASRLVGDRIGLWLGPVRLARAGALMAMAGYLVFLLVPSPEVALVGFTVAGLGIGPAVPVVFSAAGNTGTAGRASVLSIAVSAGYLGGVVGPMTIGFVAEHLGLTVALAFPLAFLTLMVAGAKLLRNAAGGHRPGEPAADRSEAQADA